MSANYLRMLTKGEFLQKGDFITTPYDLNGGIVLLPVLSSVGDTVPSDQVCYRPALSVDEVTPTVDAKPDDTFRKQLILAAIQGFCACPRNLDQPMASAVVNLADRTISEMNRS